MGNLTVEQPNRDAALLLHTRPAIDFDRNQFFQFCQINKGRRIERAANGDIIIMAPTGGSTGSGNFELAAAFAGATRARELGRFFDSSTGFDLPNGATRSPDISWVRNDRLDRLTEAEWRRFLPLCPDFLLELRSPADNLELLQAKMGEYIENGARLGWLIDPENRGVTVYRPDRDAERLENPERVRAGDVLEGFELELAAIWKAIFRGRSRASGPNTT